MAFALEHFFLPKRAATVALSRNAFEIAFQALRRDPEKSRVVGRGRVVQASSWARTPASAVRERRAPLKLWSMGWPGGVSPPAPQARYTCLITEGRRNAVLLPAKLSTLRVGGGTPPGQTVRRRNAGVLAGWLGCVLAAEWEACASIALQATSERSTAWQRDSAKPAGGDASVPVASIDDRLR